MAPPRCDSVSLTGLNSTQDPPCEVNSETPPPIQLNSESNGKQGLQIAGSTRQNSSTLGTDASQAFRRTR